MSPTRILTAVVAISLVIGLSIGVIMRFMLAGYVFDLPFAFMRHAHTHVGYYGILFPFVWILWHKRDGLIPGQRMLVVYTILLITSVYGFSVGGYNLPAIIGSTGVLLLWLGNAWQRRYQLREKKLESWVSLGILGTAICIPPVAVFIQKQPDVARMFLRTFMSLLLLSVMAPAALAPHLRQPEPPAKNEHATISLDGRVWFLLSLLTAAYAGIYPHAVLSVAPVALGTMIAVAIVRYGSCSGLLKFLWLGFAMGLAAMPWLVHQPVFAIAGLHYTILGPLLLSYAYASLPVKPNSIAVAVYALFVMLMSSSILAGPLFSSILLPRIAAFSSIGVFGLALGIVGYGLWGIKVAQHAVNGSQG